MKPLALEIPEFTPSLNVLMRKYRHPLARKRLRERYGWLLVAVAGFSASDCVSGPEKRYVRIKSFRRNSVDADNLAGGAKVLLDAMRDVRLIYDDSPEYLEVEYEQEMDRDNPRTLIYIGSEKP